MLPAVDIRYLDVKRVTVGGPRKPLLAAPVDRKKEAQGIGVIIHTLNLDQVLNFGPILKEIQGYSILPILKKC